MFEKETMIGSPANFWSYNGVVNPHDSLMYQSSTHPIHSPLNGQNISQNGYIHSPSSSVHTHQSHNNNNFQLKIFEEKQIGTKFIKDQIQTFAYAQKHFKEFLENNEKIQNQMKKNFEACKNKYELGDVSVSNRLILDISKLSTNLFNQILDNPMISLPALESASQEIWKSALEDFDLKLNLPPPNIGILGWMGMNHITPRGLNSSKLNQLVCVEGVINKTSEVHPKLVESVYIRESQTDKSGQTERGVYLRPHYDITNFDKTNRDATMPPSNDVEGKTVNKIEIGMCKYKNHQKFVIQEALETAPTGQLPRWVDVIVEDDLCDFVKCGDRVRVWGVYRMNAGRVNAETTGTGRPFLIANNIQKQNREKEDIDLFPSDYDLENLLAFSKRTDMFDVLCRSFAPSLCGLEIVKKGLILLMIGGEEKLFESQHHLRGDIHILLIGDPSCGKSQLLRYVMNLQKGAVSATGRGSSGVGLTAAVIRDQDTGENRVEAGAMVMSDKNIICIDEFDKMHQNDRVATHEVMEQQTVTVAKAGVHTTLNARCSILAAANPIYGCWSDDIEYANQLNFGDALLSRFDLIYMIKDASTELSDERIAESVLKNITKRASPIIQQSRRTLHDNVVQSSPEIYLTNNEILSLENKPHTSIFASRHEMVYNDLNGDEHEVLKTSFLKQYLHFCKHQFYKHQNATKGWPLYPELTDEAASQIQFLYSEFRQRESTSAKKSIQPVTTRTLEAFIRLSSSHAKAKLKRYITIEDVNAANELLLHTYLGETSHSSSKSDISDNISQSENEISNENISPNSPNKLQTQSELQQSKKRRPLQTARRTNYPLSELENSMEQISLNKSKKIKQNDIQINQNIELTPSIENILLKTYNDIYQEVDVMRSFRDDELYTWMNDRIDTFYLDKNIFFEWLNNIDNLPSPPLLYSNGRVFRC